MHSSVSHQRPSGPYITSTDYNPHYNTRSNNNSLMKSTSSTSNTSRRKRERPIPMGSICLTEAENRLLFEILGPERISLAAAVVQLLSSGPEPSTQWKKNHVGVVSLIKDYSMKCYTISLFDVFNGDRLWSQTL